MTKSYRRHCRQRYLSTWQIRSTKSKRKTMSSVFWPPCKFGNSLKYYLSYMHTAAYIFCHTNDDLLATTQPTNNSHIFSWRCHHKISLRHRWIPMVSPPNQLLQNEVGDPMAHSNSSSSWPPDEQTLVSDRDNQQWWLYLKEVTIDHWYRSLKPKSGHEQCLFLDVPVPVHFLRVHTHAYAEWKGCLITREFS